MLGLLHAPEDSGRCNNALICGIVLLAADRLQQVQSEYLHNRINYLSRGLALN